MPANEIWPPSSQNAWLYTALHDHDGMVIHHRGISAGTQMTQALGSWLTALTFEKYSFVDKRRMWNFHSAQLIAGHLQLRERGFYGFTFCADILASLSHIASKQGFNPSCHSKWLVIVCWWQQIISLFVYAGPLVYKTFKFDAYLVYTVQPLNP